MVVAFLLDPGFGPGTPPLRFGPAAGGASEDGVLVPLTAGVVSPGVSAGVASMAGIAAGVPGDEAGLEGGSDEVSDGSWGNLVSCSGVSLRTTVKDLADLVEAMIFFADGDKRRRVCRRARWRR